MVNKKLRKRDRALNILKAGSKTTQKGFQKIKPILNPRAALLSFILISILKPSMVLAAPSSAGWTAPSSAQNVPGVTNQYFATMPLTVIATTFVLIEESTYHASCAIPGSQWANSRIGAPVAVVGAWGCAVGASVCSSVGWHNKAFTCVVGSLACTSYVMGAQRAAPHDPRLIASRAATSPFESAKETV
jgi:hypothetical protein